MAQYGNTPQGRLDDKRRYSEYMRIIRDSIGRDERKLVDSRAFTTERFTNDVVFFFEYAHSVGASSYENTRHWYRAMPTNEYNYLKLHNQLDCQFYGGIASNYTYSKDGYLTNNGPNTHLVEFSVGMDGDKFVKLIHEETKRLQGNRWRFNELKPEDGALSIGLGRTGHYKGAAGTVFNDLLSARKITWRLCCFRHRLDERTKQQIRQWKEENAIS
ncbi:hypothetical protein [Chitinophaga sp. S165]|uniref:hypothetical protein n=1 Tax=Chitinophaga sp. S165 TaxID=2135462 RepID=UPI000D943DA8|nr:hypothetical protein [Chitinophaga sp. S165]PWV56560.1 hypothetical protein C7475_1011077 [Chitinophaga sp. S165]